MNPHNVLRLEVLLKLTLAMGKMNYAEVKLCFQGHTASVEWGQGKSQISEVCTILMDAT